MASDKLHIYERPKLQKPRLILGLSGWMNGGDVSTGTVKLLIEKLNARKFADINPEGFYINSFPGSMEVTSLFRPHTKIEDGLVTCFEISRGEFFCDEKNNTILFLGKEPNLQWREFAECIFSLCSEFGVEQIYFIGSVAGLVPHTRQPRILCSVSDAKLKGSFEHYGVKLTDYEGPASIVTYLTVNAGRYSLNMANLVATIPAYVQGNNPMCIESMTRKLANILGLQINLDSLRIVSDEFEKKLSDAIEQQPELAESISQLEENYDNETFDTEMGDLKAWLEQKGVRLD